MNERLKQLRQELGLSGEKFGEPLGVTRTAVSLIESGKNNLTEQMLKLISLTYNVNEQRLRTGKGSMFNETKDEFIESLKKEFNLTDFQANIVKTYLELNSEDKKSIDNFISSCCKNSNDN